MNSLRARVLLLVAGFGMLTALALALVMHHSVRSYYNNVLYHRSGEFLERVLETKPNLWGDYEADRTGFSERLQGYTLYSPNTGLYLLDADGRVLASAGEGKLFWSQYRVDIDAIRSTSDVEPVAPSWGDDPDTPGTSYIVAARPVQVDGTVRGWLYLVARSADLGGHVPELLRSYAIRTGVKVGLLVLAIGVLLTMAMVAVLTRPLIGLTRVAERVKSAGFAEHLGEPLFPHLDRNDEIGRLSRTFREMFERLRVEMQRVTQTDARRREMVASVSHDLRTPLTALIGQLETIRMKQEQLDSKTRQRFLERAILNAQHLKRLTDALAELARLDSPDFTTQKEPLPIGELADDVAQRYALRAHDGDVRLDVEYPDRLPVIHVDAQLIERALSNLLDNALRVTPAGGAVTVRIVPRQGELCIEVTDTGPGVSVEDRQRVFDRFYQASRHRDLRGSSGLGLAVVKRVAELHGGRVGLDTPPGAGSTFWMALPVMQAIPPVPAKVAA
jgi:two-component system OmpR family sensor kinase